jgi:hypothetical protein
VSDQAFFENNVLPVLQKNCQACHNPTGDALGTDFVLRPASQPDYIEANLEVFRTNSNRIEKGKGPLLLVKPTRQIAHQGEKRFDIGSPQYKAFEEMIQRFEKPTASCPGEVRVDDLADVKQMGITQTFRKATIALAGRIPTDAEVDAIDADPAQLDPLLDTVMTEDAFYTHLREWANDLMLTDNVLNRGGNVAAERLEDYCDPDNQGGQCDYPNAYFWRSDSGNINGNNAAAFGNAAIAREPIELFVHVVKENRPFTEIMTADYIMVNGYSAVSYGINLGITQGEQNIIKFRSLSENPAYATRPNQSEPDPTDFREGRIANYPHAGVLSSPIFNQVYDTTDTNVNRKRARFVFKYFLATDVLRDTERPVDIVNVATQNPTQNDANCKSCHGIVDPVAGAFQDFAQNGRYKVRDKKLFEFMRPPGFKGEDVPSEERAMAVKWVAQRIAADPRFVTASVRFAYTAVTGQKPLEVPTDNESPTFDARMKAFRIQTEVFKKIGKIFVDNGYNVKSAMKAVINSQLFRADGTYGVPSAAREQELFDIGTANLQTPENLSRKIRATTGYPWMQGNGTSPNDLQRRRDGQSDYLVRRDAFNGMFGGIDSINTTQRLRAPNGIMTNIVKRMANEVSCLAVPQDFSKPIAQRDLFRYVEPSYTPEDNNGFLVQGSVDKIKQNIKWLHWRILGERLEDGDPEIDRTYQLFLETWREGREYQKAGRRAGDYVDGTNGCNADNTFYTNEQLPDLEDNDLDDDQSPLGVQGFNRVNDDPYFTVRTWMAVSAYLLSDHSFIFE